MSLSYLCREELLLPSTLFPVHTAVELMRMGEVFLTVHL